MTVVIKALGSGPTETRSPDQYRKGLSELSDVHSAVQRAPEGELAAGIKALTRNPRSQVRPDEVNNTLLAVSVHGSLEDTRNTSCLNR
jgi:hypothetical protein